MKSSAEGPVTRAVPAALPLFAEIRLPAHVAPGSETSREAAALVSVDGECLRVLLWIAKQTTPPTRYDVAIGVYPVNERRKVAGLGAACGRVFDLIASGYVEQVGRRDGKATLQLTDDGRDWLSKRKAA